MTVAWAFPGVADTLVGAEGTVAGVTDADGDDAGELPTALVATTVNVYDVPFVKPVTVPVLIFPETSVVNPPGEEVIVYLVIVEPPFDTGAVHVTVAWAFPPVADTPVGAEGTAAGVTEDEPGGELPTKFLATTIKV